MHNGYVLVECDHWKLYIKTDVKKVYHGVATLSKRDLELIVEMARLCSHIPSITIEEEGEG